MSPLKAGNLVWAKMKGFPCWPGKVVFPPSGIKIRKNNRYVFFFGTNDCGWVPDKNIFPYAENIDKFAIKKKSVSFRKALEDIEKYAENDETSDSEEKATGDDEIVSESVPDVNEKQHVTRSEPQVQKGKRKRSSGDLNLKKHGAFHSEDKYNEGTVKTAREHCEKVQKRVIKPKLKSQQKIMSQANRNSGARQAQIKKAHHTEMNIEEKAKRKRRKVSSRKNASNENEIIFDKVHSSEFPVPIIDIKIESDHEVDAFLGLEEFDEEPETIILGQKPTNVGYFPANLTFMSSVLASSKAACSFEQSNASSQVFAAESDDSGPEVQTVRQKQKPPFVSSSKHADEHKVSAEESASPLVSQSASAKSFHHYNSSHNNLIASEDTRIPIVVVSQEDQAICAQRAAMSSPQNGATVAEQIIPTKKLIGFIGLGMIGSGVVKNLLLTGHKVNIWNHTSEKCNDFVPQGAVTYDTPASLVMSSDIIFLCISDIGAVNNVMFGSTGIISGLDALQNQGKGVVNMTTVPPEMSCNISKLLTSRGFEYLEAQVEGSKKLSNDGKILLLCSGSVSLYRECASCFYAISGLKEPTFLTSTIEHAPKMKLIFSLLRGTLYAGLGEAMTCVQQCNLDMRHFIEILKISALNCDGFVDKANAMMQSDFTPDSPLCHMQKCLAMGLVMSYQAKQPMLVASAANEAFKLAKFLKYGDKDVSAVICQTRGRFNNGEQ